MSQHLSGSTNAVDVFAQGIQSFIDRGFPVKVMYLHIRFWDVQSIYGDTDRCVVSLNDGQCGFTTGFSDPFPVFTVSYGVPQHLSGSINAMNMFAQGIQSFIDRGFPVKVELFKNRLCRIQKISVYDDLFCVSLVDEKSGYAFSDHLSGKFLSLNISFAEGVFCGE